MAQPLPRPSLLLEEQVHDRKGRCAIARVHIAPGTRVLETDAVASLSVFACNWCFQSPDDDAVVTASSASTSRSRTLRRCSGCKRLKYCSVACQQLDWTRGRHARECAAYKSIPPSVHDDALQTVLLVTRLTAQLYVDAPDATSNRTRADVEQLRTHYDDHSTDKLQEFRAMAQLVLSLLVRFRWSNVEQARVAAAQGTSECIVQLLCRLNCNAFTIASPASSAPQGIGLFPRGALFNHACVPNCVVSFQGAHMRVHAIAAIAPGDELTIAYVELFESTIRRQVALKTSYFFICDCPRCTASTVEGGTTKSEDAFFGGFACGDRTCLDGVVVLASDDAISGRCRTCNRLRTIANRFELEAALTAWTLQLEKRALHHQLLPIAPTDDTAHVYHRLQTLVLDELRFHPRNARVAAFHRLCGRFVLDHAHSIKSNSTSNNSDSSKVLEAMALQSFARELDASTWLHATPSHLLLRLPPRGLLHLQLGKLEAANTVAAAALQRAMQHFQHAYEMYVVVFDGRTHIRSSCWVFDVRLWNRLRCAYGADAPMVSVVLAHINELQWTMRDRSTATAR